MTKIKIAVGLFFILSNTIVNANETDSKTKIKSEYYYGVKLGYVDTGLSGYNAATNRSYNFENVSIIGVTAGYKLDENLMIEGDFATNVSPGEIKIGSQTPGNEVTWNIRTISVNGVYKGNGASHIRIKAGLTNVVINDPANLSGSSWFPKTNVTSFTYGIGMGFNTSSGKEVIVEWNVISEKFSALIFGVNF